MVLLSVLLMGIVGGILIGYGIAHIRSISALKMQNARLLQQNEMVEKQLNDHKEALPDQFKALAHTIMTEQTNKLLAANQEISKNALETHKNAINPILSPLQKNIEDFKKSLEDVNKEDIERTASLTTHIKQIQSESVKIAKEAQELTQALKGQKQKQGALGENWLKNTLDILGYQEGMHYTTQQGEKSEEGHTQRLDVVVQLPNAGKLIIDSKISINNYTAYVNTESPEDADKYLGEYIKNLKSHITILASKDYWKQYANSPEYVLMFLPLEHAYLEAFRKDSTILEFASKNNIAIVTPSSLMVVLRTIQNLWSIENRTKNVEEIAKRAGNMYDQFTSLLAGIDKVKKSINTMGATLEEDVIKKIEGRQGILTQINKLKALEVPTTKEIPKGWSTSTDENDNTVASSANLEYKNTIDNT